MKISNLFRKKEKKKRSGGFADFFLNASEREKQDAFTEAAKRANQDQRALVEKLNQRTT